jgi:hypothetical protein
VVLVQCHADLPQMVLALGSSRRFARRLHCRQKQCNQNPDDRDHDEQLDERDCIAQRRTNTWMPTHDQPLAA